MRNRYDNIIHMPPPASAKHLRMPICDRAAIFSPFAALAGHSAAIAETARLTDRRIELDEDRKAVLDGKQRILEEVMGQQPEVTVIWFQPDARKDGGSYVTVTGNLKRMDAAERVMTLTDGTRIPLDDVIDIESEWLAEIFGEGF